MHTCPLCKAAGAETTAPACRDCYVKLPHHIKVQLDYRWNRRRAAHHAWQEGLAKAIEWVQENDNPGEIKL